MNTAQWSHSQTLLWIAKIAIIGNQQQNLSQRPTKYTAWRAITKGFTAEDAEEFRDSVRNIIEVVNENAANDANSANLRESEDGVKRRKDPTNSSRPGTNLIVSNTEEHRGIWTKKEEIED